MLSSEQGQDKSLQTVPKLRRVRPNRYLCLEHPVTCLITLSSCKFFPALFIATAGQLSQCI